MKQYLLLLVDVAVKTKCEMRSYKCVWCADAPINVADIIYDKWRLTIVRKKARIVRKFQVQKKEIHTEMRKKQGRICCKNLWTNGNLWMKTNWGWISCGNFEWHQEIQPQLVCAWIPVAYRYFQSRLTLTLILVHTKTAIDAGVRLFNLQFSLVFSVLSGDDESVALVEKKRC